MSWDLLDTQRRALNEKTNEKNEQKDGWMFDLMWVCYMAKAPEPQIKHSMEILIQKQFGSYCEEGKGTPKPVAYKFLIWRCFCQNKLMQISLELIGSPGFS